MTKEKAKIRIGANDIRRLLAGDWYTLYREKLGIQPKKPFADTIHSQLGVLTEGFHRDLLSDALRGYETDDWNVFEGGLAECKAFGEQAMADAVAQVDGYATSKELNWFDPVELKFPHHSRWFEDRLDAYYPQLQWIMHVTGHSRIVFSCLWIDRHEWRHIGRDQRYINMLHETALEFLWHIENERSPKRILKL